MSGTPHPKDTRHVCGPVERASKSSAVASAGAWTLFLSGRVLKARGPQGSGRVGSAGAGGCTKRGPQLNQRRPEVTRHERGQASVGCRCCQAAGPSEAAELKRTTSVAVAWPSLDKVAHGSFVGCEGSGAAFPGSCEFQRATKCRVAGSCASSGVTSTRGSAGVVVESRRSATQRPSRGRRL